MNNAHSDWAIKPIGPASEALNELGLVDHHVHGVIRNNPTLEAFTNMITESDRTRPPWLKHLTPRLVLPPEDGLHPSWI